MEVPIRVSLLGLNEPQQATWRRGIRLIGWGHVVVFACAGALLLMMLLVELGNFAPFRNFSLFPMMLALVGSLITLTGVGFWTTLASKQRRYSRMLLLLQLVATCALGAFIYAVEQRPFHRAWLSLFGITSFEMLLLSYASLSLVIRSWAVTVEVRFAVRACELAATGWVVCALVSASLYLELFYRYIGEVPLILAGFVAVVIAGAAQVIACHLTLQRRGLAG